MKGGSDNLSPGNSCVRSSLGGLLQEDNDDSPLFSQGSEVPSRQNQSNGGGEIHRKLYHPSLSGGSRNSDNLPPPEETRRENNIGNGSIDENEQDQERDMDTDNDSEVIPPSPERSCVYARDEFNQTRNLTVIRRLAAFGADQYQAHSRKRGAPGVNSAAQTQASTGQHAAAHGFPFQSPAGFRMNIDAGGSLVR
jgi:hypothetical protein